MVKCRKAGVSSGLSFILTLVIFICVTLTQTVLAHDFWLEPQEFQVSRKDVMRVNIRNGENFSGKILPFSGSAFESFLVVDKSGSRPVRSVQGDSPAVQQAPRDEQLQIISYVSHPTTLVHPSFEEFAEFTREEGIDWVLDTYAESGSDQRQITERFMRFAKTLVRVESNSDNDFVTGMELELIARDDPYQAFNSDPISIQLLYREKPLKGIQVTVHQRHIDGDIIKNIFVTDEHGQVVVSKEPGSTYLINAVHIRRPGAFQRFLTHTDWETLWASLTFQVPSVSSVSRRQAWVSIPETD